MAAIGSAFLSATVQTLVEKLAQCLTLEAAENNTDHSSSCAGWCRGEADQQSFCQTMAWWPERCCLWCWRLAQRNQLWFPSMQDGEYTCSKQN